LVEYVGGVSSGRIQAPLPMVTAEDYVVDRALGHLKQSKLVSNLFGDALKALSELPNVYVNGERVIVKNEPVRYEIRTRFNKGRYELVPTHVERPLIYLDGEVLKWSEPLSEEILPYVSSVSFLSIDDISHFLDTRLPLLKSHGITVLPPESGWPRVERMDCSLQHEVVHLDSGYAVRSRIEYGADSVAFVDDSGFQLKEKTIIPRRDLKREKELESRLRNKFSLKLGEQKVLTGSRAVRYALLLKDENLRGDTIKPFLPCGQLRPEVMNEAGIPTFGLSLMAQDGSNESLDKVKLQISIDEGLKAFENGESFIRLPSGGWAELPIPWFEKVSPALKEFSLGVGGSFQGDSTEVSSKSRSNKTLSLRDIGIASFFGKAGDDAIHRFFREVYTSYSSETSIRLPEGIKLRDYQVEGISWIRGLFKVKGAGALLADDMGLGKTLQALCSLSFPCLIVVPTSLLPQWEDQLSLYYPEKDICVYHGSSREWSSTSDITLTSYGLLRRDIDMFLSRQYEMYVLDEIQAIKNPRSALSQAAFSLKGGYRLGLTGTPIENSVQDLWSLFNFMIPGLLPSSERVDEVIRTEQGLASLRSIIKPFIKRRSKKEVLIELPERTEIKFPCEMESMQRDLYDAVLKDAQNEAEKYLNGQGRYTSLFEKLLRLRQICVHPALAGADGSFPATKVAALMELLESSLGSGHKVLVFSQWTSALDIIEPMISRAFGETLRLDGSTRDRAGLIAEFKENESRQVLLLSLKAGGVGLNLTEADHVYFLDSWWNPAVEQQAADRVYRMGQDKPVFIYKLMVKNSIEEKIQELHAIKSALSESLLGDLPSSNRVSSEDIRFLLSL